MPHHSSRSSVAPTPMTRSRRGHDPRRRRPERMTTQNLQQTMTADDRAKFERGCDLLKRMQAGKAFDDFWVPIGEGLLAVRRTVMAALKLKAARGGYYNDAFGKLCAKTPYAEMHKV